MPSRRTRGAELVSTSWQMDALAFDIPLIVAPSDAIVSPQTAAEIDRLGGLAVLDGEGLVDALRRRGRAAGVASTRPRPGCRSLYQQPVSRELLSQRIGELRDTGARVAVRLSPQHTVELAPAVLSEGVDLLVIQGTVISAEHVAAAEHGSTELNLKTFIASLDVPVLVGGCSDYQTALHLMRTGAAGVIIGYGAHYGSSTHLALGIDVPMATAIMDAAAARRDYLDETGGRYVHLIAYGDIATGGDVAKALACGADAVMLGHALGRGRRSARAGPVLGYHRVAPAGAALGVITVSDEKADERPSLEAVLRGPADDPSGELNLFGSLRRAMGKCGYSSLKEFQKAGLILHNGR